MKEFSVIGKPFPKVDAYQKATGAADYIGDFRFPHMLHGKILRSPLPHAMILNIDISRALKHPGVRAVVTCEDTPKIKYSVLQEPEFQDKYPLACDKVRFIGDEVAAVAATSEEAAKEALELIKVDYKELPAVFDPDRAMEPGAPQIHEGVEHNIVASYSWHFGDVDEGFKESDFIFQDSFTTSRQCHASLEPNGCVAKFDLNGNLTLWTSTTAPYWVRKDLSKVLAISEGKIRIMEVFQGGSYGGKCEMCAHEAIAAFLARKSGKPVKLILDREEVFTTTRTRHPLRLYLKTGVKKDGALLAREARTVLDNGAYNSCGPDVTLGSGYIFASLYMVKNVKFNGICVYTNNPYGGAFRGYGNPQVTFSIESQMDTIAEKIGIDPMELRLKNANMPGDTTACGWKMTSCGLRECIEKAGAKAGWKEKRTKSGNRGIGMASLIHVSSARAYVDADFSGAFVKVHDDGTVSVMSGITDIGQGAKTALSQIAAEELGIRLGDVRMITMDTETTPTCMGTWGTRVTFVAGNAVKLAAADAKSQLLEIAAGELEANVEDLEARDGKIYVKGSPGNFITVEQAARISIYRPDKTPGGRTGQAILGKGHYDSPTDFRNKETGYGNICAAYIFGTHVAEVEVEAETGKVKLLRWTAAHDCGRAINPVTVEGQIEGGLSQGSGYGLMEDLVCKEGRAMNADFLGYRLLTSLEMPGVNPMIIETNDPVGPFGAKGVAEPGMVPTAAAIANAIYHAVGVRIKDLPITPDKVLKAIKEKKAN